MDEKQIQKEEQEMVLWHSILSSVFVQPFDTELINKLKEEEKDGV